MLADLQEQMHKASRYPERKELIAIYNGILFDYYLSGNDNEEFKNVIDKLKDDKDFYNKMCQKSKEGNIFYSKESVMNMWHDFYNDCIKYKGNINGR